MSDQLSAETLKDKGNEAYKKRDYEKAIEWYTQSLQVQPTAACYSNRALAFIQLERYSQGESDASESIRCDPLFTKAWLRRGICRIHRKAYILAYADLLRASELAPGNADIRRQMDVCVKEDPTLQDQTLEGYIDDMVTRLSESIKQGGTNEAVSYVDDILEFRPDDLSLMERIADLFDKSGFYEEEKAIVTKSMQRMKKSGGYYQLLLRLVRVNQNQQCYKEALRLLDMYDAAMPEEKKARALRESMRKEMNEIPSAAERAVAIVDERLTLPEVPDSLYRLLYSIQSIRHNPSLVARYLLAISPERFEDLFEKAEMDSEPYEVVIRQLNQIVTKNISHCFWAMDVLKAMSKNASFSITKSLFSKDTFENLSTMKDRIAENGKVSANYLEEVFCPYLNK